MDGRELYTQCISAASVTRGYSEPQVTSWTPTSDVCSVPGVGVPNAYFGMLFSKPRQARRSYTLGDANRGLNLLKENFENVLENS